MNKTSGMESMMQDEERKFGSFDWTRKLPLERASTHPDLLQTIARYDFIRSIIGSETREPPSSCTSRIGVSIPSGTKTWFVGVDDFLASLLHRPEITFSRSHLTTR